MRSVDVEADGTTPHALVIRTDRSFSPARSGVSEDTRELALRLTSLTWMRTDDSGPRAGTAP